MDHMPPHLHSFRINLTKKAESNATTGNCTLIQRSKLLHIYHIYLQLTLRLGLLKSITYKLHFGLLNEATNVSYTEPTFH